MASAASASRGSDRKGSVVGSPMAVPRKASLAGSPPSEPSSPQRGGGGGGGGGVAGSTATHGEQRFTLRQLGGGTLEMGVLGAYVHALLQPVTIALICSLLTSNVRRARATGSRRPTLRLV